jgi:hypothetical protein
MAKFVAVAVGLAAVQVITGFLVDIILDAALVGLVWFTTQKA